VEGRAAAAPDPAKTPAAGAAPAKASICPERVWAKWSGGGFSGKKVEAVADKTKRVWAAACALLIRKRKRKEKKNLYEINSRECKYIYIYI
jgi:hypothetical protein